MAISKNKSKRQSFPNFAIPDGITEIVWQVTNCREIFIVGSLPLIHGKILTTPKNSGTMGLGHGSFKATRSRTGNYPDRLRCYGSMGNVGCCVARTPSRRLMDLPFRMIAGAGKSVLWYVDPKCFFPENLRCWSVPQ
jgi:hypothetical protein